MSSNPNKPYTGIWPNSRQRPPETVWDVVVYYDGTNARDCSVGVVTIHGGSQDAAALAVIAKWRKSYPSTMIFMVRVEESYNSKCAKAAYEKMSHRIAALGECPVCKGWQIPCDTCSVEEVESILGRTIKG